MKIQVENVFIVQFNLFIFSLLIKLQTLFFIEKRNAIELNIIKEVSFHFSRLFFKKKT